MALTTFPAGEPIDRFSPVVVSSGGYLYRASAVGLDTSRVTGLALDAGALNDSVRVQTDSIVNNLPGLIPGERYYLGVASGTIASGYSAWAASVTNASINGAFLVSLGTAVTSTDLSVEIEVPVYVSSSGVL